MPGPLKNARHERFAQGLAKGETADAAYAAAGFTPNRCNASRLKSKDNIAARVAELQGKAAEKVIITVADIAAQLDEDRVFARSLKQSAAAVSATMGKAKVLGLMPERHEHTGRNGGPIEYRDLSDEEVEARIRSHEAGDAAHPTTH